MLSMWHIKNSLLLKTHAFCAATGSETELTAAEGGFHLAASNWSNETSFIFEARHHHRRQEMHRNCVE